MRKKLSLQNNQNNWKNASQQADTNRIDFFLAICLYVTPVEGVGGQTPISLF